MPALEVPVLGMESALGWNESANSVRTVDGRLTTRRTHDLVRRLHIQDPEIDHDCGGAWYLQKYPVVAYDEANHTGDLNILSCDSRACVQKQVMVFSWRTRCCHSGGDCGSITGVSEVVSIGKTSSRSQRTSSWDVRRRVLFGEDVYEEKLFNSRSRLARSGSSSEAVQTEVSAGHRRCEWSGARKTMRETR